MKRQSKIGHVRTHYTVIPTRLDIYHTQKKKVGYDNRKTAEYRYEL